MFMTEAVKEFGRRIFGPVMHRWFFTDLIRRTDNFDSIKWLGHPIWKNVLDLWIIQETTPAILKSMKSARHVSSSVTIPKDG
jgi:cephalosporin hydroxylase